MGVVRGLAAGVIHQKSNLIAGEIASGEHVVAAVVNTAVPVGVAVNVRKFIEFGFEGYVDARAAIGDIRLTVKLEICTLLIMPRRGAF